MAPDWQTSRVVSIAVQVTIEHASPDGASGILRRRYLNLNDCWEETISRLRMISTSEFAICTAHDIKQERLLAPFELMRKRSNSGGSQDE